MLCCAVDVFGQSQSAMATAQTNQRQNVLFSIVSNSVACDRQNTTGGDAPRARDPSRKSVRDCEESALSSDNGSDATCMRCGGRVRPPSARHMSVLRIAERA